MQLNTGIVYLSRNQHKKRQVASITKVMTCMVSLRLSKTFGISMNEKILINKDAADMVGTSAKLEDGDLV